MKTNFFGTVAGFVTTLLSVLMFSASAPSFADDNDDIYEAARQKARADIERAVEQGRANAEAYLSDPEVEMYLERQRRGYGPEPHQVLRQMLDKLADSHANWLHYPQSERTLIGLCNVYNFYVEKADFDRASKTARLIQGAYDHAERRFKLVDEATNRQEAGTDDVIVVKSYAGIGDVSELKLLRVENGNIRIEYKTTDGRIGNRTLRSPKALGAQILGVPENAFETELKFAIR